MPSQLGPEYPSEPIYDHFGDKELIYTAVLAMRRTKSSRGALATDRGFRRPGCYG
jgi:hypothetical protein